MKSSTSWVIALVGVVLAVVGVFLRMSASHHTIALGLIVLGVIVAIVGIVMVFMGGKSK